ncbi:hypothetical protein [Streptomyces sp. NPDC048623]|uniref:hypothetical protein n=1 Tax=Streptomyces sp. NPDC048623 TaxID=3155761 RepID=UPI003418361B
MAAESFEPSDVTTLVKRWIKQARTDAKRDGEHPPPPYSALSNTRRNQLHQEGHFWFILATGQLLERCVPPRPTPENIRAIREHLAQCCKRLYAMLDARGDLLPEGVRDQLGAAEQHIAMALDIVGNAPAAWSRDADAAWAELMKWARQLDTSPDYPRSGPWVPDGWRAYVNG